MNLDEFKIKQKIQIKVFNRKKQKSRDNSKY